MRSPLVLACLVIAVALAPAMPAAAAPALSAPHTTVLPPVGEEETIETATPVGDVNGDRLEDVLVQRRTSPGVDTCSPTAHIVLGTFSPTTLRLGALGSRGITITNLPGCIPAWGVSALGDVNGDGRGDFALGADPMLRVPPTIIFGRPAGGTVSFAAPGAGGVKFTGGSAVVVTGVADVGDVNGDGRADVGLSGVYEPASAPRDAAGVLFGPVPGGTVDLARPGLPGLLIGDPAGAPGAAGRAIIRGAGDVNGDGRADIITTAGGPRVVYGRSAAGFIDVRQPGTGVALAEDRLSVFGQIDAATSPDVNRDGARELVARSPGGISLLQSRRAAPHYDLPGGVSSTLTVFASLGVPLRHVVLDDVSGDGRRDMITTVVYLMRDGDFVRTLNGGLLLGYLLTDLQPRRVDLRLGATGLRRMPVDRPIFGDLGTVRFRGTIRPQVVQTAPDRVTVHDVVEVPDPPADRTPPVITTFTADKAVISTACPSPCNVPDAATLTLDVSESAYMEMEIRRGSTLVSLTRGPVFGASDRPAEAGPLQWEFRAVDVDRQPVRRLPAGVYTATLKATDLAGNVGATRSVTVTVTD